MDKSLQVLEQAKAVIIKDDESYNVAESLGKVVSKEIKDIKEYFKPLKADAKKTWQNLVDIEKESLEPFLEAKETIKKAMLGYEAEKERARLEEEARLKEDNPDADIVVKSTFKAKGQTRANWTWTLVDMEKFVSWCIKNDTLHYLLPNNKALNTYAKDNKKDNIPGIRIYNDPVKVF